MSKGCWILNHHVWPVHSSFALTSPCLQCSGAAVASIILKGLDPSGYKAAAGASNQLNKATGVDVGRGLGYEIVLT